QLAAVACFVAQALDLLLVEAQDAHHSAGRLICGGLHRLAALAHQPQAIFPIEGASENKRRVLAKAKAGGELAAFDSLGRCLLQTLQRRQAANVERRLAMDGGVESLGRTVEAEIAEVVAQNFA